MLRWWHLLGRVWKQMFRPSMRRQRFEMELQVRPPSTDAQWMSLYDVTDREFASRVVAFIERESQWPEGKLLPGDSLHVIFHGKADEDMPFARFRADIRRAFGVNLSYAAVCESLDPEFTLGALIRLIWTASRESKQMR